MTDELVDYGGAHTSLEGLIRERFAARDLNLWKQRKVLSSMTGLHQSNLRGRGIDFSEVRVYQPGDDIRTIDWRVTARTQKTHTKVFHEERERPVMIMLDQRQSLFFGSRLAFKSVTAAHTASLLAWGALNHGDRVGGLVFSDQGLKEIKPKRSKHSVLQFLNTVHSYNQALGKHSVERNRSALTEALIHARRLVKPGTALIIISDFTDLEDEAIGHLRQLTRHNDVVGVFVYDDMEKELPKPGMYQITNGEKRALISTQGQRTRENYRQQFEQRKELIQNTLTRSGMPLILAPTHIPASDTLRDILGMKVRGRSRHYG